MMIHRIRWQALIALCGLALMGTMLLSLSTRLETLVVPTRGGRYTEGIPSRPINLNPLYAQSLADLDVRGLLFQSLLRPDPTGQLQPDLATRWQRSDDGRTYTFTLRRDVLWHDGEPFDAEDVIFTIGIIQDDAFGADPALSALWRGVTAEITAPYTVRLTLPDSLTPFAPFPSYATFPILPEHRLSGLPVAALPDAPFSRFPIGTGPWRVRELAGDAITLEPNPYLPPSERPQLDELRLRFYDNAAATMAAYRAGEVLGVAQVPPWEVEAVLADESLTPYFTPFSGYTAIFLNTARPGLDDRAVREALMVALDRQGIVDEALAGQGLVADGFLMPTQWAYTPTLPRYPFDPAQATASLDAAGWLDSDGDGTRDKGGLLLSFTLVVDGSNDTLVAVANHIAEQWGAVGIRVEPRLASASEVLALYLQPRDFDMALLATPPQGLPPDPDFYPLWHSSQSSDAGENYSRFANSEADALLVAARRTLDQEERRTLYAEFQSILARELPALPLYHPIYTYAISDVVREVQLGPMTTSADRFESLSGWFLRSRRLLVERGQPTPTP